MVGKQIYKGSMDRDVLGGINQKKYFNKEELTKLFYLEADGVCKSLDRFEQSEKSAWTKSCSITKGHKAVVGISQRSKVYKTK
jgi:hypothetical protein